MALLYTDINDSVSHALELLSKESIRFISLKMSSNLEEIILDSPSVDMVRLYNLIDKYNFHNASQENRFFASLPKEVLFQILHCFTVFLIF